MKKVARAIIIIENKVLFGKRARSDAAGKWALIGGKPEGKETVADAIIREVQEELGVFFKPTFWKKEVDQKSISGEAWEVSYFFGPMEGTLKLNNNEVSEIKLIENKDLNNLDVAFDHKEVITNFFKYFLK